MEAHMINTEKRNQNNDVVIEIKEQLKDAVVIHDIENNYNEERSMNNYYSLQQYQRQNQKSLPKQHLQVQIQQQQQKPKPKPKPKQRQEQQQFHRRIIPWDKMVCTHCQYASYRSVMVVHCTDCKQYDII